MVARLVGMRVDTTVVLSAASLVEMKVELKVEL